MLQLTFGLKDYRANPAIRFPTGKAIAAGVRCLRRYGEFFMEDKDWWRAKIDLDRLDMRSSVNDMLGQLFGDYETGCRELDLDPQSETPARLGFTVSHGGLNTEREFDALNRCWRLAIVLPRFRALKLLQCVTIAK